MDRLENKHPGVNQALGMCTGMNWGFTFGIFEFIRAEINDVCLELLVLLSPFGSLLWYSWKFHFKHHKKVFLNQPTFYLILKTLKPGSCLTPSNPLLLGCGTTRNWGVVLMGEWVCFLMGYWVCWCVWQQLVQGHCTAVLSALAFLLHFDFEMPYFSFTLLRLYRCGLKKDVHFFIKDQEAYHTEFRRSSQTSFLELNTFVMLPRISTRWRMDSSAPAFGPQCPTEFYIRSAPTLMWL